MVSSIQMGEDCNARVAKSTEIQPRHFHLWEDFRTRKIAQQDSKEGITCLFYLEILEEQGYVGLSHTDGKRDEIWEFLIVQARGTVGSTQILLDRAIYVMALWDPLHKGELPLPSRSCSLTS